LGQRGTLVADGGHNPIDERVVDMFCTIALEGAECCLNDGCEVVDHLKDFKLCPPCKTVRYCAMRVRNRTAQRVGTRQRVAHYTCTSDVTLYGKSPLLLIRAQDSGRVAQTASVEFSRKSTHWKNPRTRELEHWIRYWIHSQPSLYPSSHAPHT